MYLKPIDINEDSSLEIYDNDDCRELFKSYPSYYYKVGYNPPWIGYFIINENIVVGACGFIGKPLNNEVEIAYGTFKKNEYQGIATFACRELIEICKKNDPSIIISAKTSPEYNNSTKILQKKGFVFEGVVQDEGIGDAWRWVLHLIATK